MSGALEVIAPGVSLLVQDLGRPGLQSLGIAASGALDRGAHALAARLVSNAPHAAGLELLLGGARLLAHGSHWVAVTGAAGDVSLTEPGRRPRRIAPAEPVRVPDRAVLSFGVPTAGARYVLAVRGGIDVPAVLGSRSRDTLAGLGPPPLAAGDLVPVGEESAGAVLAPAPAPVRETEPVVVEARPGPREDRFTRASLDRFFGEAWTVTPASDRVGIRLASGSSRALERSDETRLPSEPMVPGSIQVPPDGAPVVLLADHPTTGGYPVIATVVDSSLDALAQLRAGESLLFRHPRHRVRPSGRR